MSDQSPKETPEETPKEPLPDEVAQADDTVHVEGEVADTAEAEEQRLDDDIVDELDKDLPADELAVAAKPIKRKTAKAPVKKAEATRKRKDSAHEEVDPYKAKNPAHFVRQSAGELKKVVWPTWPTLVGYFFAVMVFVLFIIAIVAALDTAFGWSLLKLLGGQS